jgi:hypothetical protein
LDSSLPPYRNESEHILVRAALGDNRFSREVGENVSSSRQALRQEVSLVDEKTFRLGTGKAQTVYATKIAANLRRKVHGENDNQLCELCESEWSLRTSSCFLGRITFTS